ncbi:MAG TPA: hypothetical protein PKJ62_01085 [Bacteroidia bacterium]|nr:hypothetical protein [Bacteroidia bacterium]HNS11157.1 hypothetical protein [Bacteroidia bacterium]
MDIKFDKSTKLSKLQTDFQQRFNFLKIEFFREKSEPNAQYTAKDILPNTHSIGEVSSGLEAEPLHIGGGMKVRDVEKDFSEKLGLYVQIFRKSGKVWLITSSTDHLTLDQLDKEAKAKETQPDTNSETIDYHEQE